MFAGLAADALNQISKHRRVLPIVEAPRKFVHVERKILFADFVIRADDSTFEQTPKAFDGVGVRRPDYVLARTVTHDTMIVIAAKQAITAVFVRSDKFCLRRYALADETIQCRGIGVLDHFRNDHSLTRNRADDSDLASGSRPTDSGRILAAVMIGAPAVAILGFAANISFVNLDFASQRQNVAFHRGAPAHAHKPRCVVIVRGIFTEDHAMDLQGADSLLRGQNQERDFEPKFERNLGIFKDRASQNGEAIAVLLVASYLLTIWIDALIAALAQVVERASRQRVSVAAASRTGGTLGPTHLREEPLAVVVSLKLFVESIYRLHALNLTHLSAGVINHPSASISGLLRLDVKSPPFDSVAMYPFQVTPAIFAQDNRLYADRNLRALARDVEDQLAAGDQRDVTESSECCIRLTHIRENWSDAREQIVIFHSWSRSILAINQ